SSRVDRALWRKPATLRATSSAAWPPSVRVKTSMGPVVEFKWRRGGREGLAFEEHMYRGYVQLVHEAFDCFDRGDWDRLRPLIARDNVMTPPEFWPDPGPFIGPDES